MRELTEGFESADTPVNGWVITNGAGARANTGTINKDTSNNGGLWAYVGGSTNHQIASRPFLNGKHKEGWARMYAHQLSTAGWGISFREGSVDQCTVMLNGATGQIQIRQGAYTGSVLATSVGTIVVDTWNRIEIHYKIDDSTGFVRVYVNDNGSYGTPFVEALNVDTNNGGAGGTNLCDRVLLYTSATGPRFDDIAVNSISLSYDGGTDGVPVAGETITGGTSGATALISKVIGDGVSGRLILANVSGAFINNEVLTSSGSLDAFVNAPNGNYVNGLEPNSSAPGPGFIVYLAPTGNGNQTQLTGTDGNQTDNYLLVDDNPVNNSLEGVIGSSDGQYDLYTLSDLPVSALSVNYAEVSAYAFKDGTAINILNGVIRTGSNDYHSEDDFDASVAASAALYRFPFPLNPATNGQWTISDINAIQAGPRVRA